MKHLIPALALLLIACANTNQAQTAKHEPPEGTPEALMALLGGGERQQTLSDEEIARHPLGSAKNPVRVGGPPGERAYLARLRCDDGRYPEFDRDGSVGVGPYGYILDAYSVVCASGQKATVFMDMYHSQFHEDRAVPGFTIEPAARP